MSKPQYNITLTCPANDPQEAQQIAEALGILINSLTPDAIVSLGESIREQPGIVQKFQKLLNNPVVRKMIG